MSNGIKKVSKRIPRLPTPDGLGRSTLPEPGWTWSPGGPVPPRADDAEPFPKRHAEPFPKRQQRPSCQGPPTPLEKAEATIQSWLCTDDVVPLRAVLATYVANTALDGDPVWMMLVGGSGYGKTALLMPFDGCPGVTFTSEITGPGALLSGTSAKETAKGATGGLLREIGDSGVLVLKDFTSILEKPHDSRAQVLAALREIYDGRYDRKVGTDGGKTLSWEGRCGVLAGCTTAIDRAHGVMASMGPRFVIVRMRHDDRAALSASARSQGNREVEMRDKLRNAIGDVVTELNGTAHSDAGPTGTALDELADLVTLARSPVERGGYSREIEDIGDPEAPTRLVKILLQLWQACGLLGLDRDQSWEVVHRAGMDSIPRLRARVLQTLRRSSDDARQMDEWETAIVAEKLEHPTTTVRRTLEDLAAHGVVVRSPGGRGLPDTWTLSDDARTKLDTVSRTPPEVSGTPSPSADLSGTPTAGTTGSGRSRKVRATRGDTPAPERKVVRRPRTLKVRKGIVKGAINPGNSADQMSELLDDEPPWGRGRGVPTRQDLESLSPRDLRMSAAEDFGIEAHKVDNADPAGVIDLIMNEQRALAMAGSRSPE